MPRALPAGQDSPVQPLSEVGQTDGRMTILVVRLGRLHTREFQFWGAAHGLDPRRHGARRVLVTPECALALRHWRTPSFFTQGAGVPVGAILSRKMVSTDARLMNWGMSTEAGTICRSVRCACTWTGLSPSGEAISSLSPEPVPTRVDLSQSNTSPPLGCGSNCFQGLHPPVPRLHAHLTQSLATSWAYFSGADLWEICAAVRWSSLLTFARFYMLDISAPCVAQVGLLP